MCACACVRACVRARARARLCVRVRVHVRVCVCVCAVAHVFVGMGLDGECLAWFLIRCVFLWECLGLCAAHPALHRDPHNMAAVTQG